MENPNKVKEQAIRARNSKEYKNFVPSEQTKKRIVRQLHLRGWFTFGNMGLAKRLKALDVLTKEGYLNDKCQPTEKGIEYGRD